MKDYRELSYHSDDNLTLYARDYGSPDARTIVLCMHGLTRNSADFERLCLELKSEYRLIAIDVRGRGNSEYDSEIGNYHPARYVQDVYSLIELLKAGGTNLDNLVLLGTSMGGSWRC
ncbi:alpha/beta fold hydrolase [Dongshaea marina]|uniref:alpha/beta fold hydrolase n=1 Tax=Dongshaea marina TaxID=2047966 RepID=UPI0019004F37|nr:alpha/beta hydrolase [Dongshaea marina]